MPTKRKALSRSVRFEVFKRDKFTCQYCGRKAPDVVLEADHIHPVAKGGSNDILNIVTACDTCNGGKGARELTDDAAVKVRQASLEALQERREQLEMMLEWHQSLIGNDDRAVAAVAEMYSQLVPGWHLNDQGRAMVRGLIASHSLEPTIDALRRASAQHVRMIKEKATQESAELVMGVWKRSLQYAKFRQEDPIGSDLLYVRGIVRKRLERLNRRYFNEKVALSVIRAAHDAGVPIEELKRIAKGATSQTSWEFEVEQAVHATEGRRQ